MESHEQENRLSTVSVLLPAYESEKFIQQTLDSITAQTYENFQVIVSVDLCQDRTYDICMKHAQNDDRFIVYRQSERKNYVGNCNFLLDQAKSDYAMFAFHDDTIAPDYIQQLVAVLDEHSEVILSFSDLQLTETDGTEQTYAFTALDHVTDRVKRGANILDMENWWVPNRGLFRMDGIRHIHGLKTNDAGQYAVDWPWLFHMSLVGEFRRVPATLCYKYYKKDSLSRSWEQTYDQWIAVNAACMHELWSSSLSAEEKIKLSNLLTYKMTKNLTRKKGITWKKVVALVSYFLSMRV